MRGAFIRAVPRQEPQPRPAASENGCYVVYAREGARAITEARAWEERTDRREDTAPRGPSRVASRRFRLRHPQGRSEAEDPVGRSPEGLREAKGAIRLKVLRTGM